MVSTEKSTIKPEISLNELVQSSPVKVKHFGEIKMATVVGYKLDKRTHTQRFYVKLTLSGKEIEVQSINELQILPSTIVRKKN